MNNSVIVTDNFFDNFDNIKNHFKNVKLYTLEEGTKQNLWHADAGVWPGQRSRDFYETEPFLFNLILLEFNHKFRNFYQGARFNCTSYAHLRLDDDNEKDWIHTDPVDHTLMVYISDTNLNSGTCFYDKNDNVTQTVNFLQNRAVLFPGHIRHKALNNHGTDINNGRLTLNVFFNSYSPKV